MNDSDVIISGSSKIKITAGPRTFFISSNSMADKMIIDDMKNQSGVPDEEFCESGNAKWCFVTDKVMGGISNGSKVMTCTHSPMHSSILSQSSIVSSGVLGSRWVILGLWLQRTIFNKKIYRPKFWISCLPSNIGYSKNK